MLKNLLQMHLKLLQNEQFKKGEATGDLIGNKMTYKITKNSSQNSSETDSQTEDKSMETPKGINMAPEKRHKIIYKLRLL